MFLRLCGPPSIPLSFTVARTTRVSNPVRYPRSRASASDPGREAAFALGVPGGIYAFHRYSACSASLDRSLGSQFRRLAGVEPRNFTADLNARLRAL